MKINFPYIPTRVWRIVAIIVGTSTVFSTLLTLVVLGIGTTDNQILPAPADSISMSFTNSRGEQHTLELKIANTYQSRAQGLMGVTFLPPQTGMLFVFEQERFLTFWMKDTPLSLDIIFLDADFRVNTIYANTVPDQTEVTYSSLQPSTYAIETNANWAAATGLKIGDKFVINN